MGARSTYHLLSLIYNTFMACVYVLHLASSPEDIRYVGISKQDDATKRLKEHLWNAKVGKPYHVYNWIRKAIDSDEQVVATTVMSNLTWEQAAAAEVQLIEKYRINGADLTNMTLGGEGSLGIVRSEDYCTRLSNAHKGKIFSEEHKKNLAAVWTGRSHSEESKKKISESQKGRTFSEETRKKMSESAKKRRKT